MNILALDAATTHSGVLVVKHGKPVEWNILRASGRDVWDRITDFGEQVAVILSVHEIEVVGYEYPSGNSNHATNLKLGALMYEAIRVFRTYSKTTEFGAEMVFIKPSQVKKTGAHKDAIQFAGEQISARFHWKNQAEMKRIGNVADAVGIWLYLKGKGYA